MEYITTVKKLNVGYVYILIWKVLQKILRKKWSGTFGKIKLPRLRKCQSEVRSRLKRVIIRETYQVTSSAELDCIFIAM